jgi:hypothetical protein
MALFSPDSGRLQSYPNAAPHSNFVALNNPISLGEIPATHNYPATFEIHFSFDRTHLRRRNLALDCVHCFQDLLRSYHGIRNKPHRSSNLLRTWNNILQLVSLLSMCSD